MIFLHWGDPQKTSYSVIHASNNPYDEGSGRVWEQGSRDRQADGTQGFKPYTPNCISGDPAASLAGFKVESAGGAPMLIWETECERNTRAFWVERASNPDGVWEKVTESIPGRGTNTTGAEYRVADPTYPRGKVLYRLIEQEIGWRVIVKGVVVFD
jgi:hypothetical protein